MSAQLPAIRVGHHDCRLPLCEATAGALVSALLDPTAVAVRAALSEALLIDPALALWATYHRSQHIALESAAPGIASLADWLAGKLPQSAAAAQPAAESQPHLSPQRLAAAVAEVVAAAASGIGKADPLLDPRYLSALLTRARGDLLPAIGCSPDVASALARECGLADSVLASSDTASAVNKGRSRRPQKSKAPKTKHATPLRLKRYPAGSLPARALERWLAPPGFAALHFATLAGNLAELADLRARFDDRLEEEKLASLAEFAAGAGHEINNPLAVISGRAQLFLRTEEDPERRRELAIINTQARRVHEMIADLMLFARPPQPHLAPCDLAVIVDELVAELADRAAEQDVEFALHIPAEIPPVEADVTQVLVAMRAVGENALDALESGGRIEISLRSQDARNHSPLAGEAPHFLPLPSRERAGVRGNELAGLTPSPQPSPIKGEGEKKHFVAITVRDNGPGMPPEVRRHAFDPFFSGRGAGRGLGNGLSKCWRIITGHGGSVEIDSTPAGTCVTMLLPTAEQPVPRPQHEKASDG